MNTETKAVEIAEHNMRYYGGEYDSFKECEKSALDMAQYKEQEIIEMASLFFIDFFKELPDGPNKFKIKRDCSIEQLIEEFTKVIKD